jgi:hypothetical protein
MRMEEDTTTSKQEAMKKGHTTPTGMKYNSKIERTSMKNKETTSKKEQKMRAKKTTTRQERGPQITIKSVIRSVTFYV